MKVFKVKVLVSLKENLFDPQGKVLEDILNERNFNAKNVRVGKLITFEIKANSKDEIEKTIKEKFSNLFANPIIEKYELEIEEI
ncbi:MAG: phosphoribosylformylglycinamidine synthase subunit PurS [candidate division WOR-3 bacterium]